MRAHLVLATVAGLIGLFGAAVGAQRPVASDELDDVIKQLVVRIDTELEFGSGIILGTSPDTIYIATANHVVRRGPREAERVTVKFYGQEDKPIAARLLPNRDDALDLAVVSVSPVKTCHSILAALPFDRLGDLDALGRGDPIYLFSAIRTDCHGA